MRTFAFIKTGEFSHINRQVLAQLQARFPDLEARVIDLGELPVIRKTDIPRLVIAVAREFGLSACAGNARLRRHIGKTPYLFHRRRAALLECMSKSSFAFTFQTQSLFDASIPGTPHFIYTDHTHLENLKYPAATAATPLSDNWVEVETSAYHNARMVFTMSDNIARSLIEQYGCSPQRIECVYAGSNVSAEVTESLDGTRFTAKNILFVGVDWERKGGPALLEAFRVLRRKHKEATLTIVGCAPEVSEEGVRIVGRVPLAEVSHHYRSASVFCLPTLNEPFGLVFLEAFAYGLPIVSTRLGAIPEIVSEGKSGHLVKPQSVGELVHALDGLLSDPERCARFGLYGRKWVTQRYSWDETGRRLASHIERAADLPSRPRRRAEVTAASGAAPIAPPSLAPVTAPIATTAPASLAATVVAIRS